MNKKGAKRDEMEDSEDISVTDVKEGVSSTRAEDGNVDPEDVIAKINKEFPALPVEVVKGQLDTSDIFKVKMPAPYNKMFAYSWPSTDGMDLQECLNMGYRIDLPKEIYEANMGVQDTPYASGKSRGNRIVRGNNILAICRVEDYITRHNERQRRMKVKYASVKDKVVSEKDRTSMSFGDSARRDMIAEMRMRERAAAQHIEQEAKSK